MTHTERPPQPHFTCPKCRMTSYNPNDIREGYCGNCHAWTGTGTTILQRRSPIEKAAYLLACLTRGTTTAEPYDVAQAVLAVEAILDAADEKNETAEPLERLRSERLEYLRGQIRAERISWGETAELQSLASYIDPGDTELLQWAGREGDTDDLDDIIRSAKSPDNYADHDTHIYALYDLIERLANRLRATPASSAR